MLNFEIPRHKLPEQGTPLRNASLPLRRNRPCPLQRTLTATPRKSNRPLQMACGSSIRVSSRFARPCRPGIANSSHSTPRSIPPTRLSNELTRHETPPCRRLPVRQFLHSNAQGVGSGVRQQRRDIGRC